MKKKIVGILIIMLFIIMIMPNTNCQNEVADVYMKMIDDTTWKSSILATLYIELNPNSSQIEDIINNRNKPPQGFLTNLDIVVTDPNDEDGEWFFIHPLRSVIGEFIGLGPFFDPVAPKDTTIVHIRLLWGDIHYWPPGSEYPEEFIIDGMSLLLSWRN